MSYAYARWEESGDYEEEWISFQTNRLFSNTFNIHDHFAKYVFFRYHRRYFKEKYFAISHCFFSVDWYSFFEKMYVWRIMRLNSGLNLCILLAFLLSEHTNINSFAPRTDLESTRTHLFEWFNMALLRKALANSLRDFFRVIDLILACRKGCFSCTCVSIWNRGDKRVEENMARRALMIRSHWHRSLPHSLSLVRDIKIDLFDGILHNLGNKLIL